MIDNEKEREREEKIYECLIKMKNGSEKEKSIAFECVGILGNENLNIELKDRLTLVENMLDKHNEKNSENKNIKNDGL